MILLNVTIRCDHPGCGAETQARCDPMNHERISPKFPGFPWQAPTGFPEGWAVPGNGAPYDAPCGCPEHAALPVVPQ